MPHSTKAPFAAGFCACDERRGQNAITRKNRAVLNDSLATVRTAWNNRAVKTGQLRDDFRCAVGFIWSRPKPERYTLWFLFTLRCLILNQSESLNWREKSWISNGAFYPTWRRTSHLKMYVNGKTTSSDFLQLSLSFAWFVFFLFFFNKSVPICILCM